MRPVKKLFFKRNTNEIKSESRKEKNVSNQKESHREIEQRSQVTHTRHDHKGSQEYKTRNKIEDGKMHLKCRDESHIEKRKGKDNNKRKQESRL
jgi:hypothetical protein